MGASAAAGQPRVRSLPLYTKALYGVGAIPFGIKDQGFQALLLLYYNQVLGLSAVLTSTALLIALLADAVLDPLIGQISDTWQSKRLGRRHPFLYCSALPIFVTYIAVWNPPSVTGASLFLYLVVASIAARASLSVYEIPSLALLPELTADYDERTSLLSYRTFFGVMGGLLMNLTVFLVFLKPDANHPVGQLNPEGYFAYSLSAAAIMALLVLASAAGTHHVIPTLRGSPPRRKISPIQTLREMIEAISNRAILLMLASGAFAGIGLGLISGLQIYISTYYWDLRASEIASLSAANIVGVVLAVFMAPLLSRLIEKRWACIGLFVMAILVGIGPGLLRELGWAPANHDPALLVLLMLERVFGAACGLGAGIVAGSMVADTVEEVELRTGRRSEGLLVSVNAFVAKSVSGFGVFFAGLAVAWVNFPAHAKPNEVSADVLSNLLFSYMFILIAAFGLSIACVAAYPVTRRSHAEVLRKLSNSPTDDGASSGQGPVAPRV